MGRFGKISGSKRPEHEPDPSRPFLEHPSDEFVSAKEANLSAMERFARLRGPPPGFTGRVRQTRWITFGGQGQGQGSHADAYHIEDVRVLGKTLDHAGATVDLDAVLREAGSHVSRWARPSRTARARC